MALSRSDSDDPHDDGWQALTGFLAALLLCGVVLFALAVLG
jgi:hypothetical protein